jgi:ectoine hydroxylase-related dioxygenase (phytanoyl-CoA dioxygenase family)
VVDAAMTRSYGVHVHNAGGAVRGIVRVQLRANSNDLKNAPVDFTVSLQSAGESRRCTKRVIPADESESWIGIHSHLLRNGRHVIHWAAGSRKGSVMVEVVNSGWLAERISDQLRKDGVNLFLDRPCDSSLYNYGNDELVPWFDRPDCHGILTRLVEEGRVEPELEPKLRQFLDQGWFEIENHVGRELLARLNADMDAAAEQGVSGFTPGSSQRLHQLHLRYRSFWEITTYEATLRLVDQVLQVPSSVCQILGFLNGTQQDAHQDTIHLSSYPRGYMCGAWVALEDVQPDSGELVVYPGSHRWPVVTMHDCGIPKVRNGDWAEFGASVVRRWAELIAERAPEKRVYRPKAGSVLIWHDRLMHGGSVRTRQDVTRKSCVTHHFAQDAIVYYDSTGVPGSLIHRDATRPISTRHIKLCKGY